MSAAALVREATLEDIADLLPLIERYWRFEQVPGFDAAAIERALRTLLADPALGSGWVAVDGRTMAGYLLAVYVFSLEHGGLTAEIDEFYLDEAWRGAGVGRKLLGAAEATFVARGCSNVSFRIGRHNTAARRFYERLGYSRVDGFEMMEKGLTPPSL